jgi:hypothetical protein
MEEERRGKERRGDVLRKDKEGAEQRRSSKDKCMDAK